MKAIILLLVLCFGCSSTAAMLHYYPVTFGVISVVLIGCVIYSYKKAPIIEGTPEEDF